MIPLEFVVVFIISLLFLIKSADYLIQSASIVGDRLGVSKFAIGISAIAIGTSLPELMTAISGLLNSESGSAFVVGTVLGSNITNILLVFAILLIFSKNFRFDKRDLNSLFLLISTILLLIILTLGQIDWKIGILLLLLFILYLYFGLSKNNEEEILEEVEEAEDTFLSKVPTKMLILLFIEAAVVLNMSAKGLIISVEEIGLYLGISIYFLTLTTVAFATSLPELVVTYQAAKKNEVELAIGNLFGSNISNILMIIGVSSFFGPIVYDISNYYLGLIFVTISTLLFLSIQYINKHYKVFGAFFLTLYFFYIILLFF